MKRIFLYQATFVLLLLNESVLFAQDMAPRGKKCPDFQFNQLVNTKSRVYSLKDLKGKAIILDFWHIHCVPCVKFLPVLDSLQAQFDGKLQILPIAMEVDTLVPALFKKLTKNNRIRSNGLPAVMDTVYFTKFIGPRSFYGQYIWIDQEGIVRYYTLEDQITSENIRAFIKGTPVAALDKASQENEKAEIYDPLTSLKMDDETADSNEVFYHSSITAWKKEMGYRMNAYLNPRDRNLINDQLYRLSGINLSQLYNIAYCDTISPFPFQHPNVYGEYWYKPIIAGNWNNQKNDIQERLLKTYCFTLRLPRSQLTALNMQQSLRQALSSTFGDSVGIETRLMPCWSLVAADSVEKKLKSDGGPPTLKSKEGMGITLHNKTIQDLLIEMWFYQQEQGLCFFDETGIKFSIDMDINIDELNLPEWKDALKSLGLNLVAGQRKMKVIVIYPGGAANNGN